MGTINNIFNIKITSITSSGSVNFGNTLNIGTDSTTNTIGGANPIGDCSRGVELAANTLIDPDIVDDSFN